MAVFAQAPGGERIQPRHIYSSPLSVGRAELVKWMHGIHFGRIEGLSIVNGDPVLEPRPVIVREYKFGGENQPPHALRLVNLALKSKVAELFGFLDQLGNGHIDLLEIQHGQPFRMMVREAPR